eukprot:g13725.t1
MYIGVDFKVEQKKLFAGVKDFNPNNKQPVIVDVDGTIVYESMAINLYLAKKYKDVNPDFAPKNMKEEAKTLTWSFWVMTELDRVFFEMLFINKGVATRSAHPLTNAENYTNRFGRPPTERLAMRLAGEAEIALNILNSELADGKEYLVGNRFTVTDLNICSVLTWAQYAPYPLLDKFENVKRYFNRCIERPTSLSSNSYPTKVANSNESFPANIETFNSKYAKIGYVAAKL